MRIRGTIAAAAALIFFTVPMMEYYGPRNGWRMTRAVMRRFYLMD
jgi:hypothetical protein